MSAYYTNESAFELPDAVVTDRTTHVIEARQGEHTLTLAIVRGPHPEGKSLRQLAQGRVLDEMARLPGYHVLGEQEASWDGSVALEIASRWRHQGRVIYQQQAHLTIGGRWVYYALTASVEAQAKADAWFDLIRRSFRLRSEA